MADMNRKEDRTRLPKSRPRPDVKRPIVPQPGGLPIPPSRQQSVPPSRVLPGSGASTSSRPTPGMLPRSSEINPPSGTMPVDLFGLPDFKNSIASTSNVAFGFSGTGLRSPKHLPGLVSVNVPNILGNLASRSRITGSILPTFIQLPGPPTTRDQSTQDLPSTATDLPTRAKRPTDLPLFSAYGPKSSKDPGPSDAPGTYAKNFPSSRKSKELPQSSNTTRTSDRVPVSNLPSDATSHLPRPSTAGKNPDPDEIPGVYGVYLSSDSSSSSAPGTTSSIAGSEDRNLQGKLEAKRSSDPTPVILPGPSEITRSGDSMPAIAQKGAIPKTTSIFDRFKRFVKKGLGVKKGGPGDKEESTGLVFERDEEELEPRRPKPPAPEPKKKYKPFPTKEYNHFLDIDPIIPRSEMEKKCMVRPNLPKPESPTESFISSSSTNKSEPELALSRPASQAEERLSKSSPVSPTTERASMSIPKSETPEPESNDKPKTPDSVSKSNAESESQKRSLK